MLRRLFPHLLFLCAISPITAQEHFNDRNIRIGSETDVAAKRAALIEYVWGGGGIPLDKMPQIPVISNDQSPIRGLSDLERVDTLIVEMEAGLRSYAHHFIPKVKNNRLVILHAGHFSSFNDSGIPADIDYGMRRTLEGLLGDGFSVLAVYMPQNVQFNTSITVSETGGYAAHDELFLDEKYRPKRGSPIKYFLEPIAVYLNYLSRRSSTDDFPVYRDFSMVGLSGGGWTATVYPAIDTRIRLSISVAGSIPLYLRPAWSPGDAEQTDPAFYSIAGYPDLYVMASAGAGRKQLQILNRTDWCCFSEARHDPAMAAGLSYDDAVREFESNVRETLISMENSDLFAVEIDEAATDHTITWDAIYDTILPELNESRRYVATATGEEAVARGNRGNPAIYLNGAWIPSKIPPMAGTAALLRGSTRIHDMFYRDTRNRLLHVSRPPMTWSRPTVLIDKIIADPAAASRGPGKFDVVALGNDYKLYHVSRNGVETSTEIVSHHVKGLGQPTLIASGPDRLDLFYKSWNRKLYHARKLGNSPWIVDEVGGRMTDLPTAVRLSDGSFRAYIRGTNGSLLEARRAAADDSPWSDWESVTTQLDGRVEGSPSAIIIDGVVSVFARTPDSKIRRFAFNGAWSFNDQSGSFAGSPTASPLGAFVRSQGGSLSFLSGPKSLELGGYLD